MAQTGRVGNPDMFAPWPDHAYSIYQGPDGTYDSYADYTRDVNGIPCGIDCTRRAAERWSRTPYPTGDWRVSPAMGW
jgi:hypothetical protein